MNDASSNYRLETGSHFVQHNVLSNVLFLDENDTHLAAEVFLIRSSSCTCCSVRKVVLKLPPLLLVESKGTSWSLSKLSYLVKKNNRERIMYSPA